MIELTRDKRSPRRLGRMTNGRADFKFVFDVWLSVKETLDEVLSAIASMGTSSRHRGSNAEDRRRNGGCGGWRQLAGNYN